MADGREDAAAASSSGEQKPLKKAAADAAKVASTASNGQAAAATAAQAPLTTTAAPVATSKTPAPDAAAVHSALPLARRRAQALLSAMLGTSDKETLRCRTIEVELWNSFGPAAAPAGTAAAAAGTAAAAAADYSAAANGANGASDGAAANGNGVAAKPNAATAAASESSGGGDSGDLPSAEYCSRLRAAVFGMEGEAGRKLRDKTLTGVILPQDFVVKSVEELRTMARL
ncbi:unnamed protein product [Phaeothamnion confervicola]